jgi:hypothetical protein
MIRNLRETLTQLVEGLKEGGPYSHVSTNEYERRFFLQELLSELNLDSKHITEFEVPIVPDPSRSTAQAHYTEDNE